MFGVVRLGLLAAAMLGLAACNVFSGSSQSSAPPQGGYYNNDLHGNYPGPGTHDPNRS